MWNSRLMLVEASAGWCMFASCLLWSDSAEFQSWARRRCSTCFSCCRHRACCFAKTSGVGIPTKLYSLLRKIWYGMVWGRVRWECKSWKNKQNEQQAYVMKALSCKVFRPCNLVSKELFVVLGPFFERQFGDLQNCCACFWKIAQAVVLALAARFGTLECFYGPHPSSSP